MEAKKEFEQINIIPKAQNDIHYERKLWIVYLINKIFIISIYIIKLWIIEKKWRAN